MQKTFHSKKIQAEIEQLIMKQKSLLLSTAVSSLESDEGGNAQKQVFSSYAPYAYDLVHKEFYVFLSDLAGHSQHLINNPQASILIIEDESESEQIFARTRVQYQIHAKIIRDENKQQRVLQNLKQRFGDILDVLTELSDFRLFQFETQQGRFVKGFGQAFDTEGIADVVKPVMFKKSG